MDEDDGICNGKIEVEATPGELFDAFLQTCDLPDTLSVFERLCRSVDVDPSDHRNLYSSLKERLTSWKCKSLWTKLDKRGEQKVYKSKPCEKQKVLIVGSGPCGLRTAIEAALLGAQVVVVEKRDRFSRNNVLHLWPFLIVDLKNLGAKKFFGQFCAGAIDHISIRRLQVILLKISLLLGVQVYPKCAFANLVEPKDGHGWRMEPQPSSHPVSKFEFDVIVGADGRRAALKGFKGKEFRGKLAIGITVNLVNGNTKAEASVEEISGVAFIFNQQFFQDLKDNTGIELENIVYYKDETHYFVMCAKKQSLIKKGVIMQDCQDVHDLLHSGNISHEKLLSYAREAAEFSTNHQLPKLDFALNHHTKEDVAMFDFTSLYAAEHASRIYERDGFGLLAMIVGDSLLEPFWPTGSGCARGFLGCLDAAWMMRGWGLGKKPLELIAERESIFRLLPQTTPENLSKNMNDYTIDPDTRYPNLNKNLVRAHAVAHLYDYGAGPIVVQNGPEPMDTSKTLSNRMQNGVNPKTLLHWCQEQVRGYKHVRISDMSKSWRSGLAFCAIIHRYRPELIDFNCLNPNDFLDNNQLAFNVAEEHLGIPPQISASEMATKENPDRLMIVSYVSLYYESFKNEVPAARPGGRGTLEVPSEHRSKSPLSTLSAITRLSRKTKKERRPEEDVHSSKKSRHAKENIAPSKPEPPVDTTGQGSAAATAAALTNTKASNRISALAEQVFGDGQSKKTGKMKAVPAYREDSEHCFFCLRRVYVMERLSAESHFFHRECFKCEVCRTILRLGTYSYLPPSADGEKGHFYCRPHFNKILYGPAENKGEETSESTADPRHKLQKSKSSTPDLGPFKKLEAVVIPSPTEEAEAPSLSPKEEKSKYKKEKHKFPGKTKEPAKKEQAGSPSKRGKHERTASFGNLAKRLEARPLRRSSISSVRRSDATVKKKGRGYTFDDGLGPGEEEKKLTPLKIPSRDTRPATPTSARREFGSTEVKIDVSTANGNEPKKAKKDAKQGKVKDAAKKAAATADKPSWRLGTLERNKRKERRAMYPPLSTVFNPDFNALDQAAPADKKASGKAMASAGVNFKVVDISLNDEVPAKPPRAYEAKETRRRNSSSKSPPVSPTDGRPRVQTTGSSVAVRAARLSSLIKRDNNPAVKDDGRRDSKPRKGAVKSRANFYEAHYQDEAQVSSEESPGSKRRSLPRVPAGSEPFVSTKESTKIPKRRLTGKQKGTAQYIEREINFSEAPRRAERLAAEDLGYVLVSRDDIPPSPAQEVFEDEVDGDSSDDEPEPRGIPFQRSYARRYKKGVSERTKKQEQAKIQSELKQREQKRLRMAQSIQRELEEVEVKQAELEKEGVVVEKALRSGGMNSSEEGQLMLQWFQLVNKKNALVRYESELVIHANSIQLEDQQGRLEQEVRELIMKEDSTEAVQAIIQQKTKQLVHIVEQRNALVELLDEDRKREQEEDELLGAMMDAKGFITTV